MSAYKIQSSQQRQLMGVLKEYENLILRPGNPPIQFELMGKLGLMQTQTADKLLISSQGVRQLLSIQWSEIRLAHIKNQSLYLSDGEQDLLEIQNPDGDLQVLRKHLGLLQDLPHTPAEPVRIDLPNGWALNPIYPADRWSYLLHLNAPEIYQHTLAIPYPYGEKEADQWLALVDIRQTRLGRPSHLALRGPDGELAGGIGLQFRHYSQPLPHQAEIGYWLAKQFWGQGIMSQAVPHFCKWAFQALGLKRIQAHIFRENKASEQVLRKSGFQLEGQMSHHYLKDGHLYDGKLYALTHTSGHGKSIA